MKVIYNKVIPFKGFLAINLFGVIFVRSEYKTLCETNTKWFNQVKNHEAIHTAQMKELLFIFFYLIYFFEWVFRLIFKTDTAYRGISFEREAYNNESNLEYISHRKPFAMWRKK